MTRCGAPARRERLVAAIAAIVVLVAAVVGSSDVPRVEAAALAEARFVGTPGPLGPITVIGDSVMVGATVEPSLPNLLAQRGWGPVQFRAGLGYSAGNFLPAGHEASAANWIRWWRDAGWDAPNVVVNVGSNDVGFCGSSVACNANTIRYLLDAIGPGHTVWWSKITRHPNFFSGQTAYNQALDLVASERSNLRIWDWPTAATANSIAIGPDGVHLRDAANYRRRSVLMADDITTQLATASRVGGDAPTPVAAGAATEYEPLAPSRTPRHTPRPWRPVAGRGHPRPRSRRPRARRGDRGRREPDQREPRRRWVPHGVCVRPVATDRVERELHAGRRARRVRRRAAVGLRGRSACTRRRHRT